MLGPGVGGRVGASARRRKRRSAPITDKELRGGAGKSRMRPSHARLSGCDVRAFVRKRSASNGVVARSNKEAAAGTPQCCGRTAVAGPSSAGHNSGVGEPCGVGLPRTKASSNSTSGCGSEFPAGACVSAESVAAVGVLVRARAVAPSLAAGVRLTGATATAARGVASEASRASRTAAYACWAVVRQSVKESHRSETQVQAALVGLHRHVANARHQELGLQRQVQRFCQCETLVHAWVLRSSKSGPVGIVVN
jgi:hypothetical protein